MNNILGELLPLEIGIALSPLPVVAQILMLFGKRARSNGPAFMIGWVLALSIWGSVMLVIADAGMLGGGDDAPRVISSVIKLLLGLLFLYLAYGSWKSRPEPGEEPKLPAWMATLDSLVAISNSYIAVLRSVRLVQLTVIVTSIALFLKTGLGYALIFGLGGLPALGVRGAAIGTAAGWTTELLLLLIFVYALKTPLAASPLTYFHFDMSFLGRVLKTSMPAAANEVIWSVVMTVYAAVYAHIGTEAIAAINVNTTIEELGFVVFMGLGNACAVMVGNRIGAGQKQAAYTTARNTLILSVLAAILLGLL